MKLKWGWGCVWAKWQNAIWLENIQIDSISLLPGFLHLSLYYFLDSNFLLFHVLLSILLQGYWFSTCFEIQNVSEHNQMIWGHNPCLFRNTQTVSQTEDENRKRMSYKPKNLEERKINREGERKRKREKERVLSEWKEFVFSKCKLLNGNDACEQSCIPLSVTLHLKLSGKIERQRKKERKTLWVRTTTTSQSWLTLNLTEWKCGGKKKIKCKELKGEKMKGGSFRVLFWRWEFLSWNRSRLLYSSDTRRKWSQKCSRTREREREQKSKEK